eukprot:4687173-Prymnesium_polylepis.1
MDVRHGPWHQQKGNTVYQGNTPLEKRNGCASPRAPGTWSLDWAWIGLGTSKRVTRYQGNNPLEKKGMRVPRLPQAPLRLERHKAPPPLRPPSSQVPRSRPQR